MQKLNRRRVWSEGGQSIVVLALAIIGIVAIIGLGIDLGIVYVERVRIARAADAAALAGAQELPAEEAARARAKSYLADNDYPLNQCNDQNGIEVCTSAGTKFTLDTGSFRDHGNPNTATRIKVSGEQEVGLFFLRVVGFSSISVSGSATAENVRDLDIVIVFDRSGSMQEDTRCYGCWEAGGGQYPAGVYYPLPFRDHCEPSQPLSEGGYHYLSIEAEHYSYYEVNADYHRKYTEPPATWWAMQREPGVNASGVDARGAFMKVGPHSATADWYTFDAVVADMRSGEPSLPRLDYEFEVPAGGTYYVWIRAQGGTDSTGPQWDDGRELRRQVHVGLDAVPFATGYTCYWGPYNDGASQDVRKNANSPAGRCGPGSTQGWSWSRVLQLNNLQAHRRYTLSLWAAGAGFSLDKILITDDPAADLDRNDNPLDWNVGGVPDAGPEETHGRTGWACLQDADPRFQPEYKGQVDDLYDDQQPIRWVKEATKAFVHRLDPDRDQVGFVNYSTDASIQSELTCQVKPGRCADFEDVVASIEASTTGGSTNVADAMWDGLRVLHDSAEPALNPPRGFPSKQVGRQHNGRTEAAHIMVLMSDGRANRYPDLPSGYGNCYSDDLWPNQSGETPEERNGRECVAWFARLARDKGVIIYTIALGPQADQELLSHVADLTGGWYYYAPDLKELDQIFEDLYARIFLRLIE